MNEEDVIKNQCPICTHKELSPDCLRQVKGNCKRFERQGKGCINQEKKMVNAQKIVDEVTEELERKYSPEHQLCEVILKQHPYLKRY